MDFLMSGWVEKNIQGEICLDYVCSKQFKSLDDVKKACEGLKYWEVSHWEFVNSRGFCWKKITEESNPYVNE